MGFINSLLSAVMPDQSASVNTSGSQAPSQGKSQGSSLGQQMVYGGSNGVEIPVHQPINEPVYYEGNNNTNSDIGVTEEKPKKSDEDTSGKNKKRSIFDSYIADPNALAVPPADEIAAANQAYAANAPDYIADPTVMAMPSGEQISQMSNAEREDWQNRTEAGLLATAAIAGLPMSGMAALGSGAGFLGTAAKFIPEIIAAGAGSSKSQDIIDSGNKVKEEAATSRRSNGQEVGDDLSEQFSLTKNWSPTTQMQQYYNWLETPEGQAFIDKYGDRYTKDNHGYTNLRASGNRDMWTDVMGFGDNAGVEGWQDLYSNSGVDLSDEHAMDNMMEYLYGANAIDIGNSLASEGLLNKRVGQSLDAYDEAILSYALDNPTVLEALNAAGGVGEDEQRLDENDLVYLALASRLGNMGYDDNFLDELNRAASAAGQEQQFGFTDEGQLGYLGDNNAFLAPSEGLYDRPHQGGYNLASGDMVLYPALGLPDSRMLDTVMYMYNNGMLQPNQEFDESEVAKWLQGAK